MRAVVWGCGGTGKDFLRKKIMNQPYDIVCFTDSNSELWGSRFEGSYDVVPPEKLCSIACDIIIVCSIYSSNIKEELINRYNTPESKILTYAEINRDICSRIIQKYKDSDDPEIRKVLEEYKNGIPNILGAYKFNHDVSVVHREIDGMPYIYFEDKKMFFPRDYDFKVKDDMEVVEDVIYEQGPGSPHLYIPKDKNILKDSIILDAGVCEGNFSIKYVEDASFIYLAEADPRWWEPLERTFEPFRDKVMICKKYVSGRNNSREITIDQLIKGRLDYMKMDIEGSEVYSLLGAKKTLENNNVRCSVCSYHRQNDAEYIQFIFNSYGYKTSYSEGYMFFSFDENMQDTLDLRRGIVYAEK